MYFANEIEYKLKINNERKQQFHKDLEIKKIIENKKNIWMKSNHLKIS